MYYNGKWSELSDLDLRVCAERRNGPDERSIIICEICFHKSETKAKQGLWNVWSASKLLT